MISKTLKIASQIMSHSFIKIWIHAIWTTKMRLPLIETKIEDLLHDFIYLCYFLHIKIYTYD